VTRRITGAIFISTAALIHTLKYLNMGLMTIAFQGHGTLERQANENMPWALQISIALFILGLVYLIWGEIEDTLKRKQQK
jgi:hypothetical protein